MSGARRGDRGGLFLAGGDCRAVVPCPARGRLLGGGVRSLPDCSGVAVATVALEFTPLDCHAYIFALAELDLVVLSRHHVDSASGPECHQCS